MRAKNTIKLVADLTENKRLILAEIARGLSNNEISGLLGYQGRSVDELVSQIYEDLGFSGEPSRIVKRRQATLAFKLWEAAQQTTQRFGSSLSHLQKRGYVIEDIFDISNENKPQVPATGDTVSRVIVVRRRDNSHKL